MGIRFRIRTRKPREEQVVTFKLSIFGDYGAGDRDDYLVPCMYQKELESLVKECNRALSVAEARAKRSSK